MYIEHFHIQGFKSIADVEVEGLSGVNIFHGLNNSGRSNIFQALSLWRWLLSSVESPEGQLSLLPEEHLMPWEQVERFFGLPLFRLGADNTIRLRVDVVVDHADLKAASPKIRPAVEEVSSHLKAAGADQPMRVVSRCNLRLHAKGILCQISNQGQIGARRFGLSQKSLAQFLSAFHIIRANRCFQVEERQPEGSPDRVSHHNLKRALQEAELSHLANQKRRLAILKHILNSPPFNIGELDLTCDPVSGRTDVGFVQPLGWLPLESIGSGFQQIILILGQILLNQCPLVAIEEPELNLSPVYQQNLLTTLRRLMQDDQVNLQQIFISTHSPYFDYQEPCFQVQMDEAGSTRVTRLNPGDQPKDRHPVNAQNQLALTPALIQDLGLQAGDGVILEKNASGAWELRLDRETLD